jgi:hypothetical protein
MHRPGLSCPLPKKKMSICKYCWVHCKFLPVILQYSISYQYLKIVSKLAEWNRYKSIARIHIGVLLYVGRYGNVGTISYFTKPELQTFWRLSMWLGSGSSYGFFYSGGSTEIYGY